MHFGSHCCASCRQHALGFLSLRNNLQSQQARVSFQEVTEALVQVLNNEINHLWREREYRLYTSVYLEDMYIFCFYSFCIHSTSCACLRNG